MKIISVCRRRRFRGMTDPYFHFLGWSGSQPSEVVATHKPGTVEGPASPVCRGCSEKKTGKALETSAFKLHKVIVTTRCCDWFQAETWQHLAMRWFIFSTFSQAPSNRCCFSCRTNNMPAPFLPPPSFDRASKSNQGWAGLAVCLFL